MMGVPKKEIKRVLDRFKLIMHWGKVIQREIGTLDWYIDYHMTGGGQEQFAACVSTHLENRASGITFNWDFEEYFREEKDLALIMYHEQLHLMFRPIVDRIETNFNSVVMDMEEHKFIRTLETTHFESLWKHVLSKHQILKGKDATKKTK